MAQARGRKDQDWKSRDKMLRTFTILMLGLFQADASIWFVNYEKYILGFQSFGVILTFIISSHSQWTSIFISMIIWCFLTFPTSRCDPAHGKCVGWGLGLGIGKYWYLGLWGDLKVNIWKKEWWSAMMLNCIYYNKVLGKRQKQWDALQSSFDARMETALKTSSGSCNHRHHCIKEK